MSSTSPVGVRERDGRTERELIDPTAIANVLTAIEDDAFFDDQDHVGLLSLLSVPDGSGLGPSSSSSASSASSLPARIVHLDASSRSLKIVSEGLLPHVKCPKPTSNSISSSWSAGRTLVPSGVAVAIEADHAALTVDSSFAPPSLAPLLKPPPRSAETGGQGDDEDNKGAIATSSNAERKGREAEKNQAHTLAEPGAIPLKQRQPDLVIPLSTALVTGPFPPPPGGGSLWSFNVRFFSSSEFPSSPSPSSALCPPRGHSGAGSASALECERERERERASATATPTGGERQRMGGEAVRGSTASPSPSPVSSSTRRRQSGEAGGGKFNATTSSGGGAGRGRSGSLLSPRVETVFSSSAQKSDSRQLKREREREGGSPWSRQGGGSGKGKGSGSCSPSPATRGGGEGLCGGGGEEAEAEHGEEDESEGDPARGPAPAAQSMLRSLMMQQRDTLLTESHFSRRMFEQEEDEEEWSEEEQPGSTKEKENEEEEEKFIIGRKEARKGRGGEGDLDHRQIASAALFEDREEEGEEEEEDDVDEGRDRVGHLPRMQPRLGGGIRGMKGSNRQQGGSATSAYSSIGGNTQTVSAPPSLRSAYARSNIGSGGGTSLSGRGGEGTRKGLRSVLIRLGCNNEQNADKWVRLIRTRIQSPSPAAAVPSSFLTLPAERASLGVSAASFAVGAPVRERAGAGGALDGKATSSPPLLSPPPSGRGPAGEIGTSGPGCLPSPSPSPPLQILSVPVPPRWRWGEGGNGNGEAGEAAAGREKQRMKSVTRAVQGGPPLRLSAARPPPPLRGPGETSFWLSGSGSSRTGRAPSYPSIPQVISDWVVGDELVPLLLLERERETGTQSAGVLRQGGERESAPLMAIPELPAGSILRFCSGHAHSSSSSALSSSSRVWLLPDMRREKRDTGGGSCEKEGRGRQRRGGTEEGEEGDGDLGSHWFGAILADGIQNPSRLARSLLDLSAWGDAACGLNAAAEQKQSLRGRGRGAGKRQRLRGSVRRQTRGKQWRCVYGEMLQVQRLPQRFVRGDVCHLGVCLQRNLEFEGAVSASAVDPKGRIVHHHHQRAAGGERERGLLLAEREGVFSQHSGGGREPAAERERGRERKQSVWSTGMNKVRSLVSDHKEALRRKIEKSKRKLGWSSLGETVIMSQTLVRAAWQTESPSGNGHVVVMAAAGRGDGRGDSLCDNFLLGPSTPFRPAAAAFPFPGQSGCGWVGDWRGARREQAEGRRRRSEICRESFGGKGVVRISSLGFGGCARGGSGIGTEGLIWSDMVGDFVVSVLAGILQVLCCLPCRIALSYLCSLCCLVPTRLCTRRLCLCTKRASGTAASPSSASFAQHRPPPSSVEDATGRSSNGANGSERERMGGEGGVRGAASSPYSLEGVERAGTGGGGSDQRGGGGWIIRTGRDLCVPVLCLAIRVAPAVDFHVRLPTEDIGAGGGGFSPSPGGTALSGWNTPAGADSNNRMLDSGRSVVLFELVLGKPELLASAVEKGARERPSVWSRSVAESRLLDKRRRRRGARDRDLISRTLGLVFRLSDFFRAGLKSFVSLFPAFIHSSTTAPLPGSASVFFPCQRRVDSTEVRGDIGYATESRASGETGRVEWLGYREGEGGQRHHHGKLAMSTGGGERRVTDEERRRAAAASALFFKEIISRVASAKG